MQSAGARAAGARGAGAPSSGSFGMMVGMIADRQQRVLDVELVARTASTSSLPVEKGAQVSGEE